MSVASTREPPPSVEPVTAPRRHVDLVRQAILAASSHNTQPWKFRLEPDAISILPDLSRRCPAVDPDDHHLYASLGCATENLLIAAQATGLRGHYAYSTTGNGARVDFEEMAPSPTELFAAIPKRQCSRAPYDGSALATEQLRLLEDAGQGDGVSIRLLTDHKVIAQVAEFVVAGNTAQFADPAWARELKAWIRFNAREADATGDGLYGPVMGSPDVPRWLGSLFMRLGFSAERQNRKDVRHIQSSAAVAVVHSEINDIPHWVEAGRCYERLALKATALDLRTAFINQPVEVPVLRAQFAAYLGIGHRRPDFIVRIGRGPEMPRSRRRPVESVLA